MKHRVPLRDSTMKAGEHWLEVETGRATKVFLNGPKGEVSEPVSLSKEMAKELAAMQPGVIIEAGPMRFYRTEGDVRISFTEPGEEGEPAGYDRFDTQEFLSAFGERKAPRRTAAKKAVKKVAKRKRTTAAR